MLTPFFSAYFGILRDPTSSDSATVRIILTGKHIDIGSIRNGKNVRWHFVTSFASIKFGASMSIYGKSFVGIDSYTEEARVRLKITIEHCTKIGFIRSNLINRQKNNVFHIIKYNKEIDHVYRPFPLVKISFTILNHTGLCKKQHSS